MKVGELTADRPLPKCALYHRQGFNGVEVHLTVGVETVEVMIPAEMLITLAAEELRTFRISQIENEECDETTFYGEPVT